MNPDQDSNQKLIIGSLWQTDSKQDRLILKLVGNEVCFAVRGGDEMNEFDERYRWKIDNFHKDCNLFSKAIDKKRFEEIQNRLKPWLDEQK